MHTSSRLIYPSDNRAKTHNGIYAAAEEVQSFVLLCVSGAKARPIFFQLISTSDPLVI